MDFINDETPSPRVTQPVVNDFISADAMNSNGTTAMQATLQGDNRNNDNLTEYVTRSEEPDTWEPLPLRAAVECFYKKHNPEKLGTIDTILERYEGNETQLVLHLIEKYQATDIDDLQIFNGSLNAEALLEITARQIELSKQTTPTTAGADESSASKTSGSSTLSSAMSGVSFLSGVASNWSLGTNGTVGTSSGTTTASATTSAATPMFLSSSTTPMRKMSAGATAISSSDELLLNNRISQLQGEVNNLDIERTQLQGTIKSLKSQVSATSFGCRCLRI
jgi:hypothetical protein